MKRILLLFLLSNAATLTYAQTSSPDFSYRATLNAAATNTYTTTTNSAYLTADGLFGNTLLATDHTLYTSIKNAYSTSGTQYLGILNKINIDNSSKTLALSAQVALPNVNNTDLSAAFSEKQAPGRDISIIKNGQHEYLLSAAQQNNQISYFSTSAFTQSLSADPINVLSSTTGVINIPNDSFFAKDNLVILSKIFGKKIAVNGNKIAISGNVYYRHSIYTTDYSNYGFVLIYTLNADGTFSTPTSNDLVYSFPNEPYFGENIHFDGDDLFVSTRVVSSGKGYVIRFRTVDNNNNLASTGRWKGIQSYSAQNGSSPLFGSRIITTPTSFFINYPENNRVHCFKRELTPDNYDTTPQNYSGKEVGSIQSFSTPAFSHGKFSTSIVKNGNIIAVGNPEATVNSITNAGAVHFYKTKIENGIEIADVLPANIKHLVSNEPSQGAKFGSSIAFSPTQRNLFVGKLNLANATVSNGGAIEYFTFDHTLPVDLVNFSVKKTNERASISWETAIEKNNSHFELQKSTDGINFSELTKVNAKGSNSTYHITDSYPTIGINYYKLIQYDLDGNRTDLGTKSLRIANLNEANIEVYPNPVVNVINIVSKEHNFNTLKIYDLDGRLVKSLTFKETDKESIDVSDLKSGMYLLKITGKHVEKVLKITK